MLSNIHKFRSKLESGKLCVGAGITFSDPAVVEAIAPCVDFLWIDLEHNPTSLESLLTHLIAARAGGAPVVVRIPGSDIPWIKRVLDTGAEGILLPQADSAQEIRDFVSACRYPPMGNRGYGPRRPSNYGRNGGAEYVEQTNRELFVAAQIETKAVYDQIDEVVAIDGLDSLVMGPYDFSGSIGMLGEVNSPEVAEAIKTVATKAKENGKFMGAGLGASPDYAMFLAELGVQWLQAGNDFEYLINSFESMNGEIQRRHDEASS